MKPGIARSCTILAFPVRKLPAHISLKQETNAGRVGYFFTRAACTGHKEKPHETCCSWSYA
ncbi:MAG TPA: hypothetical protein VMW77_09690 [Methanoregula sp.]|nr:hypothetical protein [Methanoregula sp.]